MNPKFLYLCAVAALALVMAGSFANAQTTPTPPAPPAPTTPTDPNVPAPKARNQVRRGENSPIFRTIRELKASRIYLEKAPHDFGGHRADALRDVDAAIKQLEIALKYEREHEAEKK